MINSDQRNQLGICKSILIQVVCSIWVISKVVFSVLILVSESDSLCVKFFVGLIVALELYELYNLSALVTNWEETTHRDYKNYHQRQLLCEL